MNENHNNAEQKEDRRARMQKVRRSVDRLRGVRRERPQVERRSLLERLKAKLGLGEENEDTD